MHKIEHVAKMIKKFLAKLANWTEQREDFSKSRFRVGEEDQAEMTRERHEQIMAERDREYVSEWTVPTEREIVGPGESKEVK